MSSLIKLSHALLLAFVLSAAHGSLPALAQNAQPNVQFNNKSVDLGARGDLRVNPSTLGMEIQIPLGNYPGRAGANIPITISYSSKVWRVDYNSFIPGHFSSNGTPLGDSYTRVVARYAENSAAGWTSSLSFPFFDNTTLPFGTPSQLYDFAGNAMPDLNSCGTQGCYYIDRLLIWMPDGSSHELRSSDQPKSVNNKTPLPDDLYAVDGSRIRYQRSSQKLFMPDGSYYKMDSNQYVDRNGNTLTYNGTSWTDTLGRTISVPPLAGSGANIGAAGTYNYSIPGVGTSTINYTFVWKSLGDSGVITSGQSPQFTADSGCPPGNGSNSPNLFTSDPFTSTCITNANTVNNPVVLYQIILPTNQAYTFTYNVYGEIDKVQLPTGGYERYEYARNAPINAISAPYNETNRGVLNRFVSASGTGSDEAQWHYDGSAGISITAPDNSLTERHILGDVGTFAWSYSPALDGRAYDERYYSAPDSNNVRHMLRRKLTDWTTTGSNAIDGTTLGAQKNASRNPRVTREVEILLDTGGSALAKTTTYGYDTTFQFNVGVEQTSKNEYDFVTLDPTSAQTMDIGSIPPGTTLLRMTQIAYLTINDSYRNRNILGLPTSVTVQNSSGTPASKTLMNYDEPSYQLNNNYGSVTGWTDPGQVRGSLTTVRSFIDANATAPFEQNCPAGVCLDTHTEYDQLGNVVGSLDANGNLTQTAYSGTFAYAYPTSGTLPVPDPTGVHGLSTAPSTSTNYDFQTGLITSTMDINNQTTTFQYADPFDRLTQVNLPDGGRIIYNHVDASQCGAYVETRTLLDTSGRETDSYRYFDGLGRDARSFTFENQDTNNPWLVVDKVYDSMGRVSQVSVPYRSSGCGVAPNPSGPWTTTKYDELGRVISVTLPDAATVNTYYSGNQVLVRDPVGNERMSQANALGQLSDVWEITAADDSTESVTFPNRAEVQNGYRTKYQYDTLGDLITVTQQKGTSGTTQTRTFTYDSLKRITSATNPEVCHQQQTQCIPVTVTYDYDLSGNLKHHTDARNIVTTFNYDALNRPVSKSYQNDPNGTPPVSYFYDVYEPKSMPTGAPNNIADRFTPTNIIGRLVAVTYGTNSSAGDYYSYDALGRDVLKIQQTGGINYQVSVSYNLAGAPIIETYPSGRTVTNTYDGAGRTSSVTGTLGDSTQRTYSSGITYSPFGGMSQEQLGTTTPIYNKLFYNVRGQLAEIREGTQPNDTSWNRGAIINHYSNTCWGMCAGHNMTDNNGNVKMQEHWIPLEDVPQPSTYQIETEKYEYDSLNRLQRVYDGDPANPTWQQQYVLDRFGNRLIDTSKDNAGKDRTFNTGVTTYAFGVDPNTNRLTAPSGFTMSYDDAGNLVTDTYSAAALSRAYDAENRMTSETNTSNVVTATYTYDAEGHRVKRNVGGTETWQVYGFGGELLAEYAANNGAPNSPQKEYGYRNGELLITASFIPNWAVASTVGSGGSGGAWGAAPSYTGPNPLSTGSPIMLENLTELRAAVNQLRQNLGLQTYNFAVDPTPQRNVTTVKADHILQLRAALEEARLSLGLSVGGYAHPNLRAGDLIYAQDFQELRDQVGSAWSAGSSRSSISRGAIDIRWLVADQLGTPRIILDQSGSLANVSRHDYLPFGEDLSGVNGRTTAIGYSGSDGGRQKFTGYERDNETGLDYAQTRYYSNLQGRFTSPDKPFAGQYRANPQSWNMYQYVLNCPLVFVDPMGLSHKNKRGQLVGDYDGEEQDGLVWDKKKKAWVDPVAVQGGTTTDKAPPVQQTTNVEVIIFRPSATAHGLFGHVAYNINGTIWSWELGGWHHSTFQKYMEDNSYRDATGYVLGDENDPDWAEQLAKGITSWNHTGDFYVYGLQQNNCGEAFCSAINNMPGVARNYEMLPSDHETYIKRHLGPYIRAVNHYPRRVPAPAPAPHKLPIGRSGIPITVH